MLVLDGLAGEVVPRIVDGIRAANAHAVSEDALQAVLNVTAGDITARFDELFVEVPSQLYTTVQNFQVYTTSLKLLQYETMTTQTCTDHRF